MTARATTGDRGSDRRDALLLLGLVLVGLLLRLPAMNIGIWSDEATTALALREADPARVIDDVIVNENNPPGYFLLAWAWATVAGTGDVAIKVPSLVLGLLLIPATYWLGRLVARREVALLAALMATVAGTAIYQSQEARAYTAVALLGCLTVCCYLRLVATSRPWAWVVPFALCGAALLYAQYTGGLLLAGLVIATVVAMAIGRGPARALPLAVGFGAVAVAYLPWLPVFWSHVGGAAAYEGALPVLSRPLLAVDALGYGEPLPSSSLRSWTARAVLGALAVALVVIALRPTWRARLHSAVASLPTGVVTTSITLGVVAVGEAALSYGERYMFVASSLAWVLLSLAIAASVRWLLGVARTPTQRTVAAIGVAVAAVAWIGLSVSYAVVIDDVPKSGVRTMVETRRPDFDDRTLAVFAPDYLAAAYAYYLPAGPTPHGIAHWSGGMEGGPERWREGWLAADPEVTMRSIADEADVHPCLAFVYEPGPYPGVGLPYDKSDVLYERLRATYPIVSEEAFEGRNEHPTLIRFALRPGGCATHA